MLEVTVCGRLGIVVFTENIYNTLDSLNSNSEYDFFNPIPAGGGGQFDPPPVVFFT